MKLRKGFTLVELLIVIVIIGILAAAMMLSSGSATDSAEASNIVSDLRNLKSASMLFFMGSMDEINGGHVPTMTDLAQFSDNPDKYTAAGSGFSVSIAPSGQWSLGFDGSVMSRTGVQTRLTSRAASVGLFSDQALTTQYAGGNAVYMIGR